MIENDVKNRIHTSSKPTELDLFSNYNSYIKLRSTVSDRYFDEIFESIKRSFWNYDSKKNDKVLKLDRLLKKENKKYSNSKQISQVFFTEVNNLIDYFIDNFDSLTSFDKSFLINIFSLRNEQLNVKSIESFNVDDFIELKSKITYEDLILIVKNYCDNNNIFQKIYLNLVKVHSQLLKIKSSFNIDFNHLIKIILSTKCYHIFPEEDMAI